MGRRTVTDLCAFYFNVSSTDPPSIGDFSAHPLVCHGYSNWQKGDTVVTLPHR